MKEGFSNSEELSLNLFMKQKFGPRRRFEGTSYLLRLCQESFPRGRGYGFEVAGLFFPRFFCKLTLFYLTLTFYLKKFLTLINHFEENLKSSLKHCKMLVFLEISFMSHKIRSEKYIYSRQWKRNFMFSLFISYRGNSSQKHKVTD